MKPKRLRVNKQFESSSKGLRSAYVSCQSQVGMPSWRFRIMDTDGPFGWNTLVGEVAPLLYILPKLKEFETMTWQEIVGDRHHAIKINQLSSTARQRLTDMHMDDIDEVFSFALSGRQRIIGIRDRDVFRVLWWDPDHQVCPSVKKHT